MSAAGWQTTAINALAPQIVKVMKIFEMGVGWELWAQAELGIQRIIEKAQITAQEGLSFRAFKTECSREQKIYKDSDQRCDFITSYGILPDVGEQPLGYLREFLELKCLVRGDFRNFQEKVKKDIAKVRDLAIAPEWEEDSEYVYGTVLAITVHTTGKENYLVAEMQKLALDNGIQWHFNNEPTFIGIFDNSRILAWVWTREVYAREP